MGNKLKSKRWKMALNLVTIAALVILAYVLRDELAETFRNLGRVNKFVLLFVLPLQALSFYAQANLYQSLFRILGDRFRFRSMYRLALELIFVNNVFPSGGVSGFSYLTLRMRDEGISTAKATLVQMMRFILLFIGFQVLLFVGLVMLAIGGRANDFILLMSGMLATLILVATLLIAFVIGSKSRIKAFLTFLTKVLNGIIHIFRRKHPETINIDKAKKAIIELHENYMMLRRNLRALRRPLGFALLTSVSEILTIYVVYVAFSQWVNPGAIILAYAVANFAGLVSVLPGGIGIYEALMTAVLAAGGVPPSVSLPVTVMYRVLNMSIQIPSGYFFYHRTLHAKPALEEHMHNE